MMIRAIYKNYEYALFYSHDHDDEVVDGLL